MWLMPAHTESENKTMLNLEMKMKIFSFAKNICVNRKIHISGKRCCFVLETSFKIRQKQNVYKLQIV